MAGVPQAWAKRQAAHVAKPVKPKVKKTKKAKPVAEEE